MPREEPKTSGFTFYLMGSIPGDHPWMGVWCAGSGGLKKPACRGSHGRPDKLRLEFPGAIYPIINRGNDRRWVFDEFGAKAAFEACLFDTCKRCAWR